MMIAVRSVVAYILIVVYIAVAGPVALVAGGLFRWEGGLFALGHFGVWLALALTGIKYRVSGLEGVPPTAVVYCSNHESNVDPPVLFEALHPRLKILYKAELRKVPIMKTAFDVAGFVNRRLPRSRRVLSRFVRDTRSSSFRKGPGARPAISSRSRRAASSWPL